MRTKNGKPADETLRDYIRHVLETGTLMSIATADAAGVWVSDVNYVSDRELNIYWVSNTNARHSVAIEASPQIAGTITISGHDEDDLGIQFAGRAERLDGPRADLIALQYAKRRRPVPRRRADIRKGASWYVLRPTMIELIHEKYFGYEKQKLILP
ncbi:MAG: pyridoxamine 5'-phosphate oxidase family protein [Candidatus Kerfeldbacteria bacterium]|nr:pyridoxamine 5'-phosphate oxidase family protein [Candidatus Kerfeldbacteria bacterium]